MCLIVKPFVVSDNSQIICLEKQSDFVYTTEGCCVYNIF